MRAGMTCFIRGAALLPVAATTASVNAVSCALLLKSSCGLFVVAMLNSTDG